MKIWMNVHYFFSRECTKIHGEILPMSQTLAPKYPRSKTCVNLPRCYSILLHTSITEHILQNIGYYSQGLIKIPYQKLRYVYQQPEPSVVRVFFTICYKCVLYHNSIIIINMIITLKSKLDNEHNQESITHIVELVNDLIEYIQTCTENKSICNILTFLNKKDKLSVLAQTVSSQLSATNKKIESNLEMRRIFGSENLYYL